MDLRHKLETTERLQERLYTLKIVLVGLLLFIPKHLYTLILNFIPSKVSIDSVYWGAIWDSNDFNLIFRVHIFVWHVMIGFPIVYIILTPIERIILRFARPYMKIDENLDLYRSDMWSATYGFIGHAFVLDAEGAIRVALRNDNSAVIILYFVCFTKKLRHYLTLTLALFSIATFWCQIPLLILLISWFFYT